MLASVLVRCDCTIFSAGRSERAQILEMWNVVISIAVPDNPQTVHKQKRHSCGSER